MRGVVVEKDIVLNDIGNRVSKENLVSLDFVGTKFNLV
jgi:hypothetical protein